MATEPFVYNAPRKMTDAELARALKYDAAAEIDAMNLYEAHIQATDNEDARKLLRFIAKDEKEHFALFLELIKRLDPEQAKELQGVAAKLDLILSTPSGTEASEQAVDAAGDASQGDMSRMLDERERARQLTVGSLLGQVEV